MFNRLKCARRIDELQEMVADLTRIVKARDLDWEDMRARCKRLLDRTEKAARRVVESEADAMSAANGGTAVDSKESSNGRLTAHQREVQQQILRRRAGLQ